MVCYPIAFDKKPGKFQEKDEEQGSDILFFCPELIGANHKTADNGHDATYENEETEELEKEIKKGADCTGLKDMGKRDSEFHEIAGRESFDHVHSKSCHESKYQQGMSEPAIKRLAEKLSVKDDFSDEDLDIPTRPNPESFPTSSNINLTFFPFGGILFSFERTLQPHADMETHPPEEEDQRRKKHDVEDEVLVHDFKIAKGKGQRA